MAMRTPLRGFFGADAPAPPAGTRLYGLAEAERQIKVAQRLHAATNPDVTWGQLSMGQRRAFIDQACVAPYDEQH